MRIAFFNSSLLEGQDGVTRVMYKIINAAKQRGIEIIAFGASLPPEEQRIVKMVKVKSIKFPLHKAYPLALPDQTKIADELDRFNPSLIHINSPCPLGFAAMKYARKNNIPIVATYHTHFPTYPRYYNLRGFENIVWKLMKRLYNNIDRTFVPNARILEELESHGIRHLTYLPNGIDTSEFNPSHYSDEWRSKVNGQSKSVLLFISRLVWEKNIKILAEVYNKLKNKRNDFSMVVVGDGHARIELEKMMKGAHFLGFQKGKDLQTAYSSSDIFLFPSTTETFGLVTLEAMASGLVPVAANVGGATGIIDDGINGLLAQPDNTSDFVEKIELILKNVNIRHQMSGNAIKKSKLFKWELILHNLFNNYEEVIKEVNSRKIKRAA